MSTSTITKKAFALAAAAGLSLSLSPLMVGTASAATASKTIKSSCRTNGAPMNFNETREKTDVIDVSAPDQVKVGEEYEVRVNYKPEMIPGKESIAVIKSADDVVMRLTIDDPSSFVTASLEGSGAVLRAPRRSPRWRQDPRGLRLRRCRRRQGRQLGRPDHRHEDEGLQGWQDRHRPPRSGRPRWRIQQPPELRHHAQRR
ncbi:MAG: hypothetical protein U1U88_001638 [Lawsonella clevelandensis]